MTDRSNKLLSGVSITAALAIAAWAFSFSRDLQRDYAALRIEALTKITDMDRNLGDKLQLLAMAVQRLQDQQSEMREQLQELKRSDRKPNADGR